MFGTLCSSLSVVIDVQKQAPSTSKKFGSYLGTLVGALQIIIGSFEFLPIWPTHGCDVSFPCTDGDWKAIGPPMPGLAESGWPGAVGRVVVAV